MDTETGRIESIYADKGWYGDGYKRVKIRSEEGNATGTYSVPNEMIRGFKKGEWVYYDLKPDPQHPHSAYHPPRLQYGRERRLYINYIFYRPL